MPILDPERRRAYQREWIARRRAEFFAGKCCVDCGSTESLELDHVDPETKVHHAIWSWSQERRETETAKCVVRCEACHRERHAALWRRHGRKRYEKGCRCDVCRAAKAENNAARRRRDLHPDSELCRLVPNSSATPPSSYPTAALDGHQTVTTDQED